MRHNYFEEGQYSTGGSAQSIEHNSIKEWSDWSLKPHTEAEIREKCLTDYNNVCFSYVCGTSKMSEDFIEELMALSTGVLTKKNYDEMYEKVHQTVLEQNKVHGVQAEKWYIPEAETHLRVAREYNPDKIIRSSSISDRIDWFAICKNQTLSEGFMRRFYKQLSWREVALNQRLSSKFKEDFNKQLSEKNIKIGEHLATQNRARAASV